MTSAFAHYQDIIKRRTTGLIKLGFFQNTEFMPVLERNQSMGNEKSGSVFIYCGLIKLDLKISETKKYFWFSLIFEHEIYS